MITEDRKNTIAEQLVLRYDFTTEEAADAVTSYVEKNPDDIDDDLSDEEAADLINENND